MAKPLVAVNMDSKTGVVKNIRPVVFGATPGATSASLPLAGIDKSITIGFRTDGRAGSGTSWDPYDGSTAAKFDAIFAAAPTNCEIIILAGTFLTAGGALLKDGHHVRGAGINVTTVKLANNTLVSASTNFTVLNGFQGAVDALSMSVRDLTIDTNLTNQSGVAGVVANSSITAVSLQTVNGRLENIKVIGGFWANPGEGFPINIFCQAVGRSALSPAIAIIRNVQYFGNGLTTTGYVNASIISCFDQSGGTLYANEWMTGEISNCTVLNAPGSIAFGAGGWYNFNVARNRTQNVNSFMVQDTHKGWNVTVQDNVAEDFGAGAAGQYFCLINGNNTGQYKNYKILRNTARVKTGASGAAHLNIASPDMADLVVEGNLFDANGTTTASNQNLWQINTPSGGVIRNNQVSSGYFISSLAGGSVIGPTLENNRRFNGVPLRDSTHGSTQAGAPFLYRFVLRNLDLKVVTATSIFNPFLAEGVGGSFLVTDAFIVPVTVTALSVQAILTIRESGGGGVMLGPLSTGTALSTVNALPFARPAAPVATCNSVNRVEANVTTGATATTCLVDLYVFGYYI